jgi:DNA polymerase-3 subunit alpha
MAQKTNTDWFDPTQFVHLHNHTHYSLLDGLQKVPEMLDRVKELGMESVAITDHGSLSGVVEFYKGAKDRDLKPIIGMETYIAPRGYTDKDGKQDANPYHLVLLAMDNQGYENLMRLSTLAHLEGFYYKPRIDRQLLEQYNQGLIALSACVGGELGEALREGRDSEAQETAQWYKDVFGDRYYLELQDHGHEWDEQARVNDKILELGEKLDIQVVVTADAHYCSPEDQDAHEVLLCIQTGSLVQEEKRMSLKNMHLHLSDPQEMAQRWQDHLHVMTNTKAIADRCQVEIPLDNILIPEFDVPDGKTEHEHLKELGYQGLAWRYGGVSREESAHLTIEQAKSKVEANVIERFEYELSVISNMGFVGYFLIVADFINWGKDRGIIFGPGRGSAAGSLVSYAVNITDLDPLSYGLLFERFLNPDRVSMPDIDIDIQDDRRGEVIDYTISKYGEDKVANIVTFGTMAARNATRDTARVLGVSFSEADRIAKMIPPPQQGRHIPLEKSLREVDELKEEYENNPQSKEVFDQAVRLEGTIRSHGVHAAGVVIAPDEIVKYTPLEIAQKGAVSTQYSMGPVEELGLLKIDFLGLANLTIIKNALRIIRKVYGEEIDISAIPLDDPATFDLFRRADTTGVFQFESSGMQRYMKQLSPDTLEDLIALSALYRPGPLSAGYTDDFVATKNGEKEVAYDHPGLQNALEPTYGVLVYQEQVIQIAREMCGFSGNGADTLRKAISKKKADLMAKMKSEFVEGMVSHSGVDREFAENYWGKLESFADYCFNKSHSASYSLISYQTAYLKANYTAAFMAALMTSDAENTDRISIEIDECRHMNIPVLPPDVNESYVEFAVRPDSNSQAKEAVRFGMSAIKNVGVGAVEEILRARDDGGQFTSVEDFAKRVAIGTVNRKTWESLIKAGAFDELGDRATLLHNLDKIIAFAQKTQKEAQNGQTDLFGDAVVEESLLPKLDLETPSETVSTHESLQWERHLLGVYLSHHPLDAYDSYLATYATPLEQITSAGDGKSVAVGGLITDVREITTKNGAKMAFAKIEDKTGELEVIVFPRSYAESPGLWQLDTVVLVNGKINTTDKDGNTGQELKILADTAREIPAGEEPSDTNGKAPDVPDSGDNSSETTPQPAQYDAAPKEKSGESEVAEGTTSEPEVSTAEGGSSGGGGAATATTATQAKSAVATETRTLEISLPAACGQDTLVSIKQLLNQHQGSSQAVIAMDGTRIKLPFTVAPSDNLVRSLQDLGSVETVTVR